MYWLYLLGPIALEIACVIHAVKTGRVFPWIYVIIFLPLVGCIAYFAVEIVPEMARSRGAQKFHASAKAMADPNRSLREAQRGAEMTGSVDAKRTLAEEYVKRGNYADAVELYRDAATGQFRDDPALLLGLARALFLSGDGVGAQAALDQLQVADPNFVSDEAHLIYARALEMQGKNDEALAEYERLVRYFSGEEARGRYAQLLQRMGRNEDAKTVYAEILKRLDGAPKRYQTMQKEWGVIAKRALG
ncbi:MAG TPA: tetratricopeptide repeat protein [Rhizomicrobium sp.]|jgi:hypothetical protein|nr:tetratricopeptide repeat protein [Rhizomicrobium sp.]